MAAVLGLPLSEVDQICAATAQRTGQVVEVANDNEPAQVVIPGQADAVRIASAAAVDAEARRGGALGVGAVVHCSLMAEIAEQVAAAPAEDTFHPPARDLLFSGNAT